MSTIKQLLGASTSITITYTSLANNTQKQSTAVNNSNLALDALVQVKFKTNAAGTVNTGYLAVYAYGSVNGGTDYTDGATGVDGGFTATQPPNIKLVAIVNAVANATTYVGGPFSIAAAFGGVMPDHWGIIVENQTGAALDAAVASAVYEEVSQQVV